MADILPEESTSVSNEPEASQPLEPSALEGMRIQRLVQAVDADAVNSWHFDTLQLQTEDIVAYLCQMFVQLNLVRLEPIPVCRRASNEQGTQDTLISELVCCFRSHPEQSMPGAADAALAGQPPPAPGPSPSLL